MKEESSLPLRKQSLIYNNSFTTPTIHLNAQFALYLYSRHTEPTRVSHILYGKKKRKISWFGKFMKLKHCNGNTTGLGSRRPMFKWEFSSNRQDILGQDSSLFWVLGFLMYIKKLVQPGFQGLFPLRTLANFSLIDLSLFPLETKNKILSPPTIWMDFLFSQGTLKF